MQAPYLPWSLRLLWPWRWPRVVGFVSGAVGELFRPAEDGSKHGYVHGGRACALLPLAFCQLHADADEKYLSSMPELMSTNLNLTH